jgi:hypothetical protein
VKQSEKSKGEEQIAAMVRVQKFMRPYARRNRNITFGKALAMAYSSLKPEIESNPKPPWVRSSFARMWPAGIVAEMDTIGLLVVCPAWRPDPIWAPSTTRFLVIHAPSKMALCSGLGWERSMKLAEELAWLDWTLTGNTVLPQTLDKAWVIVQAFRFLKQKTRVKREAEKKGKHTNA